MKKLALSAFLCLGLFGCGESGQAPTNTETATQATTSTTTPTTSQNTTDSSVSTLPANAPVVHVATSGVLPPLTFLDDKGALQGIDVDIIRAIGENQGIRMEVVKDDFVRMLPGIETGKYQVVISGLSLSPERTSKFGHTNFYMSNPPVIMHNPNVKVTDLNSLKPLRVATMKDTIQDRIMTELNPASHERTATVFQLFQGLVLGKYDAVLQDKYFLEYIANNYPDQSFPVVEYDKDEKAVGIVMYTKKDDHELINKLNAGIENLKASGEIDRIIKKHMTHIKEEPKAEQTSK